MELVGQRISVYFTVLEIIKQFSKWLYNSSVPPAISKSSTCSIHIVDNTCNNNTFNFDHSAKCVVVFHCGFNLITNGMQHFILCLLAP